MSDWLDEILERRKHANIWTITENECMARVIRELATNNKELRAYWLFIQNFEEDALTLRWLALSKEDKQFWIDRVRIDEIFDLSSDAKELLK